MTDQPLTPPGLNMRQAAFVREYVIDFSATQAAIRAGYSPKTAGVQGCNLLAQPKIQAAVQEQMKSVIDRCNVRADEVIRELAYIAFSDPTDVATWDKLGMHLKESGELSEAARRSIASVTVRDNASGRSVQFKMHDKLRALELLGKYLALFVDRVEIKDDRDPVTMTDVELIDAIAEVSPEVKAHLTNGDG